jgi:hypothetical protein
VKAIVIASSVFLAACSAKPEVAACEKFLKDGLRSPSDYKQIKVSTMDNKLPLDVWRQLRERTGFLVGSDSGTRFDQMNAREGGLRVVAIEYDAPNAFGTNIRGTEICRFLMSSFAEGKFNGGDPSTSAVIASTDRTLAATGVVANSGQINCCLSKDEKSVIGEGLGDLR